MRLRAPTHPRRVIRALRAAALVAALVTLGPPGRADEPAGALDVVVLTDGRRIVGEIVGQDEDLVSIRADGVLRAYPRKRVASVEQAPRPAPATEPTPNPTSGSAGGAATPPAAPEPGKRKRARPDRDAEAASLSPAAAAWLDELIAALTDRTGEPDPVVTRSIAAAIGALGPAAAPRLDAAAAATSGAAAELLGRLAASAREKSASRKAERADGDPLRRENDRIVARLREELDLTETQEKAVVSALAEYRERQKQVLRRAREEGLDRPAAQALFQEARAALLTDVRVVLDDAQAVALGDIVRETMDRRKKGQPGVD